MNRRGFVGSLFGGIAAAFGIAACQKDKSLIQAFRSKAPGGWSDDRAQEMKWISEADEKTLICPVSKGENRTFCVSYLDENAIVRQMKFKFADGLVTKVEMV